MSKVKLSPKRREQLSLDLAKFFDAKLRQLVQDTAHTCQIGGLTAGDCVAVMTSSLMKETVLAAGVLGMDASDFVSFARQGYDHIADEITKMKQKAPKDE